MVRDCYQLSIVDGHHPSQFILLLKKELKRFCIDEPIHVQIMTQKDRREIDEAQRFNLR